MTTDIASLCINGATSVLRNIYTRQANILRTKCLYVEGPRAQCRGAGPKSAPTQVPVTLPGTSYFLTSMEKLISEILGHTNRQAATHLTRGGAVPNAKWHTSQIIRGPHAGPFTFHQNLQLGALGRILKRQADLWGGANQAEPWGPRWRDLVSPLGFDGNEGCQSFFKGHAWPCTGTVSKHTIESSSDRAH